MAQNYPYMLLGGGGQGERMTRKRIRNIGILTVSIVTVLTIYWFWDSTSTAFQPIPPKPNVDSEPAVTDDSEPLVELLEDPLGDLVEPSPAVTTPPSPVVTFGSDPDYQASESSDSSELDAPAANAAFEYVDGVCRMHGVRTLHLGGEPGFQVFQNVGYFNRTFYFFGDDETLPKQDQLMSGTELKTADDSFHPGECYGDTTLLVNEGATPGWNGLYHYYHFTLEDTLGGFAGGALAQPEPLTPSRLAVPWGNDWHDQWHMNDAVTASLFGENIIDKDMWAGLADKPLFFDKLIFVDRWAAHRNSKLVEVWHKMPVQVFETLITRPGSSHFFDKPRQQLLDYFAIPPAPAGKQVRIAYIDRQSSNRKIPEDQHMTLVAEMKSLADSRGAHFAHLVLEDMTPDEQFREVAQANVMIGIHGNGLTHLIWLQSGAAVIEMFPQNVFQRDYQTAAAVLGFNYTGISGDRIITQALWEADPGNKNGDDLQNGTPVNISVPLVMDRLTAVVDARLGK